MHSSWLSGLNDSFSSQDILKGGEGGGGKKSANDPNSLNIEQESWLQSIRESLYESNNNEWKISGGDEKSLLALSVAIVVNIMS